MSTAEAVRSLTETRDRARQLRLLSSPAQFAQVLSEHHMEPWLPYRHLMKLDELLVRCAQDGGQRIIVEMPPRHGKSHLCSRWTPAWR